MAEELIRALERSASADQGDQNFVRAYLESAATKDFPQFVYNLSQVLRSVEATPLCRSAAGLQLKNLLIAKDVTLLRQNQLRWMGMTPSQRTAIKENILATLGTEQTRPSIAAQCVSSVACTEFAAEQENGWPTVIPQLKDIVINPASTEQHREASLETLGYICESIVDSSHCKRFANDILTAIINGMSEAQPVLVRRAATRALNHSLSFVEDNFGNEQERTSIVTKVCEATQCKDVDTKVAALECLVYIADMYYEHLEQYMAKAIFAITFHAMQDKEERVKMQGIEFWTTICEVETNLKQDADDAEEDGRTPEHMSKHYALGASQHIVPVILICLTQQEDDADEDDWTPSKSAGVCLAMLAGCLLDDVVPLVIGFITENISQEDWHRKEAAIMAFGSIMEGPDAERLSEIVKQAMPFLIAALATDSRAEVRDTSAWCIGRACDTCPEVCIDQAILEQLLGALGATLQMEPRVATNALSSLAHAANQVALTEHGGDSNGQPPTYKLSFCFKQIIDELQKVTVRADAHTANLRIAAFEAIMEFIKCSPVDCYPVVLETTVVILKKIQNLMQMEDQLIDSSSKEQYKDMQALLCSTLSSVISKMNPTDAKNIGDEAMVSLMTIMAKAATQVDLGVMEDALMAVDSLITTIGESSIKYVATLMPHVFTTLNSVVAPQAYVSAMSLVVDLCRTFPTGLGDYLDPLMTALMAALQRPDDEHMVHTSILSSFGDMALALGGQFERYIQVVLDVLARASTAAMVVNHEEDYEKAENMLALDEACMEAYTGVLQSLEEVPQTSPTQQVVQSHVEHIVTLINHMATTEEVHDSTISVTLGLVGDLLKIYGMHIMQYLDTPNTARLMSRGKKSKSAKCRSLANYVMRTLRDVRKTAADVNNGQQAIAVS